MLKVTQNKVFIALNKNTLESSQITETGYNLEKLIPAYRLNQGRTFIWKQSFRGILPDMSFKNLNENH